MGISKTGCYHIFDGDTGRVVVTRPARASAELGQHYGEFVELAKKDSLFLTLKDPQVDASIEVVKTSYIAPDMIYFRPLGAMFDSHKMSRTVMAGACGHCHQPLPAYQTLLDKGIVDCPYCDSVFVEAVSSPIVITAWSLLRKHLKKIKKSDPNERVPVKYKIPYGYPTPKAVKIGEIEDKHFEFVTEEVGLEWATPEFYKHLNRHKVDTNEEDEEAQEIENPEE